MEGLRREGIKVSFLDLDPYLLDKNLFEDDMIHFNGKGNEAFGKGILDEIRRLANADGQDRVLPPRRQ